MTIGRVVAIKAILNKMYTYITEKSVKQRICICIVLTVMITLLFFTIKENFFGCIPDTPQTSASESAESSVENETSDSISENYEPPQFHVSLIDVGVLLAVIAAYSVHKIREKIRHRRM